jgi:predicted O-methyltransferase YrrM
MNLNFDPKDSKKIIQATIALVLVVIICFGIGGSYGALLFLILCALVLPTLGYKAFRMILDDIRKSALRQRHHYEQTESYIALVDYYKPAKMLPMSRKWRASPDFLKMLAELIEEQRPKCVVELGGGISSLIVCYALQKNHLGKLWSFDHESEFALQTRDTLESHGLHDLAMVYHAPLINTKFDQGHWQYYDFGNLLPDQPINLLIVDGPPAKLQKLSRYPALLMLNSKLSKDAVIIVDDGDREDEKLMVKQWTEELNWTAEYYETEKGTWILRRK